MGIPLTGQISAQSPQPVHLSSLIYRGLRRIFILKADPLRIGVTCFISEYVKSLILGWRAHSTILGAKIHIEQSKVGKVLSN